MKLLATLLLTLLAAAAHAAPTVLPWGSAAPGLLAVGSDPRTWGTPGFTTPVTTATAFIEGGQQNTPGAMGCANNTYTFNWLPDTSGTQCGFASGAYTVYTAYDGTWVWFGVVVNDATDFTGTPGVVGANEAPSASRRDNVEFRIGTPAQNYVAAVCQVYPPPNTGDLFLVGVYRNAANTIGLPAGYPEVGDRWRLTEGIDWNRWTINAPGGDTTKYIAGARVRLSTLGTTLANLRVNTVVKNQSLSSTDNDANRVWLSGDKSIVATPGDNSCAGSNFRRQFQLSDNWARLDVTPVVQLNFPQVPLPGWSLMAMVCALAAFALRGFYRKR